MRKKFQPLWGVLCLTLAGCLGGGSTGGGGKTPRGMDIQTQLNAPEQVRNGQSVDFKASADVFLTNTARVVNQTDADVFIDGLDLPSSTGVDITVQDASQGQNCYYQDQGATLAPNEICYIHVKFDPTSDGGDVSGDFDLKVSGTINQTFTIPLNQDSSLNYVAASELPQRLEIDFQAGTPVIFPAGRFQITVRNTSQRTLQYPTLDLSGLSDVGGQDLLAELDWSQVKGGQADESNSTITSSTPLVPNETQTFSIVVQRSAESILATQLVIDALENNETNENVQLYAANAGDFYPKLSVEDGPGQLSGLTFNQPGTQNAMLTNLSDQAMAITSTSFTSHDLQNVSITQNDCQGQTINSGQSCQITLQAADNAWRKGSQKGELTVDYDVGGFTNQAAAPINVAGVDINIDNSNFGFLENDENTVSVTLSNPSSFDWQVGDLSNIINQASSPADNDFSIDTSSCANQTITHDGGQCEITITNDQNATGGDYTFNLDPSNDNNLATSVSTPFKVQASGVFTRTDDQYPAVKAIELENFTNDPQTVEVSWSDALDGFEIYDDQNWCDQTHCPNSCFDANTSAPDSQNTPVATKQMDAFDSETGQTGVCYIYAKQTNQPSVNNNTVTELTLDGVGPLSGGETSPSGQETYSLENQGVLYAAGDFTLTGNEDYHVAQYDGTTWSDLGQGPTDIEFNNAIEAVTVDSLGQLYVGGAFTDNNGQRYIARYNDQWRDLGSGPLEGGFNNNILSLAISQTGPLYVGGAFFNDDNLPYIATYSDQKWQDIGFYENVNDTSNFQTFVTLTPSNDLYVGGFIQFADNDNRYIAQYENGVWDKLVSANDIAGLASGGAYAFAFNQSDDFYTGGVFNVENEYSVAKKRADNWTNPLVDQPPFNDAIWALVFDASDRLYAGGNFKNDNDARYVARFASDAWEVLGSDGGDGRFNQAINQLVVDGDQKLYVAGNFTNGSDQQYVAVYDISSDIWQAGGIGGDFDGEINTLVLGNSLTISKN